MRRDSNDIAGLFRQHADLLYRTALRMLRNAAEAEDAVQDAFLRLRRSKAGPDNLDNPTAWLVRVLRNICIDRQRQAVRRLESALPDEFEAPPHSGPTPEGHLLTAEKLRLVSEVINDLPPNEAETLRLVVIEGLSYRDVATITGVPIGTVRSRLARARQAVRRCLGLAETALDQDPPAPTNVVSLRGTRS